MLCVPLLFITACGSNNEQADAKEMKREHMWLDFKNIAYDLTTEEFIIDYYINIPTSIVVHSIFLESETGTIVGNRVIDKWISRNSSVGLVVTELEKDLLIDGEYKLGLTFNIDYDEEINREFLEDSIYGGYSVDLIREYNDSEFVSIDSHSYPNFDVTIRSKNTLPLAEIAPLEDRGIVETVEEIVEITYSKEFIEYNKKFYAGFKNYLDLIGSNFELIEDGYISTALVEDLIMYTDEFNELLSGYEKNAIRVNEKDENLFELTTEMITYQREANANIKKGLHNGDDLSLLIAGEYLSTVVDIYIKGYKELN